MQSNRSLQVLAAIGVVFLLQWGAPFFVPLFVALLISYALSPVVGALVALVRWRVLAAAMVVLSLVALAGVAAWAWSDDAAALWNEVPSAARSISRSLQRVVRSPAAPISEVKKAAAELESATQTGKPAPAAAPPLSAAAATPVWRVIWEGWKNVMLAAQQVMVVMFLVFFMLASGDLFKRKLVAIAEGFKQKRIAVDVVDEINAQVRRYLVVLLVSDVLVGLGTWLAFWALGMKYAALWGFMAGVIHTAPYFGPALVALGSLIAALVQFDEWPQALLVAGASIAVATLVGMLFSTWLASRRTEMNTTATFIGLLFFGWLWGFWGILLGIPLLAIVKTICENYAGGKPIAELLSR